MLVRLLYNQQAGGRCRRRPFTLFLTQNMALRKSVIVQCGRFNRVVSFDVTRGTGKTERELLCDAIRAAYSERIGPHDRLTLQVKSEEWDEMISLERK